MIEARTYRMEAHTTSDDDMRYRDAAEVDAWRQRDPIERYRRYLTAAGLLDETIDERITADAEQLATDVRGEIYDAPHGDPLEIFDHVYVDDKGHFEQQRSQLSRELADREG